MIQYLNKKNILYFFQLFIGFGCALFTVSYLLFGSISFVWILLTTLLFSIARTLRYNKKQNLIPKS